MKKCSRCKIQKDLLDFPKKSSKPDGLNNSCRDCYNKYQNSWYQKNKNIHIKRTSSNTKRYRELARDFVINFLLQNPCVICGEDDIVVLEFDHIDPKQKMNSVSKMVHSGLSIDKIKEEIDKCQVLCANCHRRKTSKQFGWYKG